MFYQHQYLIPNFLACFCSWFRVWMCSICMKLSVLPQFEIYPVLHCKGMLCKPVNLWNRSEQDCCDNVTPCWWDTDLGHTGQWVVTMLVTMVCGSSLVTTCCCKYFIKHLISSDCHQHKLYLPCRGRMKKTLGNVVFPIFSLLSLYCMVDWRI